jgi:hypothetical protein
MLASAIAAFVRSEGIEAAASIVQGLDEETDEARGVLFEAAFELQAVHVNLLLEVARGIRGPAARAIALAKAAARATRPSPIAAQALDEARRAVDALDASSARRTAVVELAGAFAAAGRFRDAFRALPRQAPNELIDTLARWPEPRATRSPGAQLGPTGLAGVRGGGLCRRVSSAEPARQSIRMTGSRE